MEYATLGSTGLKVSPLCLGTWRFNSEADDGTIEINREEAHDLLDVFSEKGGNFIDTSNDYGGGESERWIGEWLDNHDREDYVITSKVYWSQVSRFQHNLSRKNIRAEIEGTLDRLDTDYLDIYYIHRWDDNTPIRKTLQTLNQLVQEGKVHYLGASSMAAWQLTKGLWKSDSNGLERFEVTQPKFNAINRQSIEGYLDVCADQDLAVCPYSPLASGFLTGKYTRNGESPEGSRGDLYDWNSRWEDRQWQVLETIKEVGKEIDATPVQVSLRWLMDRGRFMCVPIVGARTVGQLEENLGAIDVSLSDAQSKRITESYYSQE